MPRLIFYDIDGTLIDSRTHRIPDSAVQALEAARANGCLNIINTGRTLCNLDCGLDGAPIDGWIIGCGTRILLHGKELFVKTWTREECGAFRSAVLRSGLSTVYEGDTALWFEKSYPSGHPAIEGMRAFSRGHGILREIEEDDPGFEFVKLFTFDPQGRRIPALLKALSSRFTAIDRGGAGGIPDGWELVPAGFSKATGIDLVRQKLGVALEDCYAVGDSENDLSMLSHVRHSIAMGNAEAAVKSACSYVTTPVGEDGIRNALAHFNLI
ncbi:MAG: HAD family phosphatase [Clostridia bacterium]|nr:HAD family phosphatase [Clostridia bacterium]